jgi:hypothetical protein
MPREWTAGKLCWPGRNRSGKNLVIGLAESRLIWSYIEITACRTEGRRYEGGLAGV